MPAPCSRTSGDVVVAGGAGDPAEAVACVGEELAARVIVELCMPAARNKAYTLNLSSAQIVE